MIFYSAMTGGFYDSSENMYVPEDALEITNERHAALLEGPASGLRIIADENGRPILADPLPLPENVLIGNERFWRDGQLAATDGLVSRHRDELEGASMTTLTSAHYTELQTYRRELRKWPESRDFPLIDHRPESPDWLPKELT
ncbi:phage tail assembly chaperone [Pseudomonas alliivorans]|uniref:Phage tail protein n=1 Tax=Pseudomonas alliivorans TaxID=2810613 RepID=A0ABS4C646_9PSED|nr:phage tail assembly chaperone [Pseudomonas alliivorans]MBP0946131.1 phage tail protein [Pseudomonas alliivorans]MEE4310083.1 phage tail assembly chaperone [Pseudomonas alliivorans]MEE4326656.1 phage tail assembly chaperone [Pseudomonas alliivorans]MEE4333439.1 phage tail assembly chaperone [Pseudomonas alliivorans]MEE4368186.1 phage tail assembly chaperone [Pseudomonas alliivorans]